MTQSGNDHADPALHERPFAGPDFLPVGQQLPQVLNVEQPLPSVETEPLDPAPSEEQPVATSPEQEIPQDLSSYSPPLSSYPPPSISYPTTQNAPGQPYQMPPPGIPGYGQNMQPGYGMAPGYGQQWVQGAVEEHPRGQTVLTLGIIGAISNSVAVMSLIGESFGYFFSGALVGLCSFAAWVLGSRTKKEIKLGAPYLWKGKTQVGYTLGVVSSIVSFLLWGFILLVIFLVWTEAI